MYGKTTADTKWQRFTNQPVKGDVFRERFDEIFGKKEKSVKKGKQEKTQCPHCATFNLVKESHWLSRSLKCGWSG